MNSYTKQPIRGLELAPRSEVQVRISLVVGILLVNLKLQFRQIEEAVIGYVLSLTHKVIPLGSLV